MIESSRELSGRVLMLTDVTQPGGVGTHLANLVPTALREHWRVRLVMEDSPAAAAIASRLQLPHLHVSIEPLHRRHPPNAVKRAIETVLSDFRPDLVHVHCGSPRSALLPRELVVESGIPLIFTEHFVAPDLDISPTEHARISRLYGQATAVVSVSVDNSRLLRDHFGWKARRSLMIRYGVRLGPEDTGTGLHNRERLKAITVARLVPQKGIDVLLDALGHLPECVRDRVRFTVAGSGDQEAALRRFARERGVEESVSFIGWRDDVDMLLRSHDLFILPSRAEGEPIALLEALAAGLPCIASSVSGIPESLMQGAFGDLVPPNDPAALSAAITRFVHVPSVLIEKARKAREHLARHHDLDSSLLAIVELWQTAL